MASQLQATRCWLHMGAALRAADSETQTKSGTWDLLHMPTSLPAKCWERQQASLAEAASLLGDLKLRLYKGLTGATDWASPGLQTGGGD